LSESSPPTLFVGVDWATQKHDVCVIRPDGEIVAERAFPNTGAGLAEAADWLLGLAGEGATPDAIAVSIEVPHGPVVDTLLERGMRVHAVNPKQLDRFRDRFTVAGAKDDRRDARVLADSLRTDGHAFRRLSVDAPLVIELREFSRMAEDLKKEKTGLGNRLREQLRRYFPQVLQLTNDVSEPWLLDLLEAIPTPHAARTRRISTIERILKANRIRRLTAEQVQATLRQKPVVVAPGTIEAATAHVRLVTERLRLVSSQIAECHRAIDALIEQFAAAADAEGAEGASGEQRDARILRSLPGVGRIVLATLLAEAARPLAERDYHALRALSGVAPVTRRSGKRMQVVMRQACAPRLRNAVYHWARVAAQCDSHWKARYAAFRARGHSHGRACRAIADRLLNIAITMLRNRTLYDPSFLAQPAAAA